MKIPHYNVRPRYTAGSGAMVARSLAFRVAAQERDAHKTCLTGVYGPEAQARAEILGLHGIVEEVTETRKGWDVLDLCTGERYLRQFTRQASRR